MPMTIETTKQPAAAVVLGTLLTVLLVAAGPARADHREWSIGAGFELGGVFFHLAFGAHDHHSPDYYYRTSRTIRVRGHHCSDLCFRDGRTVAHHQSCPVLGAYLSHHRVRPVVLFDRYAPPPVWRGHHYESASPWRNHRYDDRYRRHDRSSRHDRDRSWDRSQRSWRDDRYDHDHWRDHRRSERRDRSHRQRGHHRRDRGHRGGGHDRSPP
jgi:hypothetical protein